MATLTVLNTQDSGAGSLRDAVSQAQPGDIIQFSTTLANQTITLTSGEIVINPGQNITIDGTGVAGLQISGNNASRIFHLNSTSVTNGRLTVRNLTLTNAYTNELGGAIRTEHQGRLTVENVRFANNVADQGGGAIFGAFEGDVTVINSQFDSNRATAANSERGAGAIAFFGTGNLTVQGSSFTNNVGINGGAINSLNGTMLVENSSFIGNDVSAATVATGQANPTLRGYGGAIYTDRANNATTIRNSLFENNRSRAAGGALYLFNDAEDVVTIETTILRNNQAIGLPGGEGGNGGAIEHFRSNSGSGSFTLVNSSLIGNTSSGPGGQGGGLRVAGVSSNIVNSTFAGNSAADGFGGAITTYSPLSLVNSTLANNTALFSGALASGSDNLATVRNTIFANNSSANTGVSFNSNQQTNRPIIDAGGNLQSPGGPTISTSITLADPQLGALQQVGNVVVLPIATGSVAINTGTTNGAPTFDARGATRDGQPDVGAFEFGTIPPTVQPPIPPIVPPTILPPPIPPTVPPTNPGGVPPTNPGGVPPTNPGGGVPPISSPIIGTAPTLQISDVRVFERNTGRSSVLFRVSLSEPSSQTVSVNFSTANGSAIAGQDYQALSGSLQFRAGQTQNFIQVGIFGDRFAEANETFSVNLSGANNATIQDGEGVGTILNDDQQRFRGFFASSEQIFGVYQRAIAFGRNFLRANSTLSSRYIEPANNSSYIQPANNGSAAQSYIPALTNPMPSNTQIQQPLSVPSLTNFTTDEIPIDPTSWM